MAMFGHVRRRHPSREELQYEAALVLAARIGAGKPPLGGRRRPRPTDAPSERSAPWYRSAAPSVRATSPTTRPFALHTVRVS